MKIGDLAKATNTLPETVRFYEREGLLPSPAGPRGTTAATRLSTPSGSPSFGTAAAWT